MTNFPDDRLYSLAISVSPSNFYVGSRGVIHSSDGGISWEYPENGLGAAKYEFLVNPDDLTGLYLVQGNEDDQWMLLKGNYEQGYFDKFAFDYPGYPSFHDGVVYISKGTELWRFTPQYNKFDLVSSVDSSSSIHFVADPIQEAQDAIFGTGDPNYFFRSEDGGKTWDKIESLGASTGRLFFNPSDRGIIYSTTVDSMYISFEVLGKSWEPCAGVGSPIPDSNTAVIDPANPDTLYAGTDKGVFVSNDQGNRWTGISDGLPGEGVVYSILVRADGNVFAATPFGVYRLEGR